MSVRETLCCVVEETASTQMEVMSASVLLVTRSATTALPVKI